MPRILTTVEEELEKIEFAKKAALDFEMHPDHSTCGSLEPGSYLAIRWGLGNDCVLVLKLDENFESINYQNLVKKT